MAALVAEPRPMKIHKADFLLWEAPHRYDLVVCSQVLELAISLSSGAKAYLVTTGTTLQGCSSPNSLLWTVSSCTCC